MANVFFDANIFIDLIEKRRNIPRKSFADHVLFLSPLSLHILVYVYKYNIPEKKLAGFEQFYTLVSINPPLVLQALEGPTKDFEDNVQLHSAAQAECDFFLTQDKKLLKLHEFEKVKIVPKLSF